MEEEFEINQVIEGPGCITLSIKQIVAIAYFHNYYETLHFECRIRRCRDSREL